jgi:hypothetical protein
VTVRSLLKPGLLYVLTILSVLPIDLADNFDLGFEAPKFLPGGLVGDVGEELWLAASTVSILSLIDTVRVGIDDLVLTDGERLS